MDRGIKWHTGTHELTAVWSGTMAVTIHWQYPMHGTDQRTSFCVMRLADDNQKFENIGTVEETLFVDRCEFSAMSQLLSFILASSHPLSVSLSASDSLKL